VLGLSEADASLAVRRDLVGSVAGEIEAVTGGRQMEGLRRRVREELQTYLTPTGRLARGGPLQIAEDEVTELSARADELEAQAAALRTKLADRRALRRERDEIGAPEAVAERRARLERARQAAEDAERHRDRIGTAQARCDAAEAKLFQARQALEKLGEQIGARDTAERDLKTAEEAHKTEAAALHEAEEALRTARALQAEAEARLREALRVQRAVSEAETARMAATRRAELQARLERARALRDRIEQLSAEAAKGPDARAMRAIEAAETALAMARHARTARGVAVTLHYAPGAPVATLDGTPLENGARTPLPEGGSIDLPGLGRLDVHPGTESGKDGVREAMAGLERALQASGAPDTTAARNAHAARQEAVGALQGVKGEFAATAPEGIEALQAAIASLPPESEGPAPELPNRDTAESAVSRAQSELAEVSARVAAALETDRFIRERATRAAAVCDHARNQFDRASAALPDPAEADARRLALAEGLKPLESAARSATDDLAALTSNAPDVEAASAAFSRARAVVKSADERLQEIGRQLAGLDAQVSLLGSHAVEEVLAETRGRLQTAERQRDALRFEVAVLQRLDTALSEARQSAQDHYIRPVMQELLPLIRMIWPDAEPRIDADTLLPVGLDRTGVADSFDQLSGGAQEQIALLVRLAFARLLARSGRPAPVILDDAIIYTDDARIELMFDALTRQAADLQIVVFSCRQRAFRDLGGTMLTIRPAAPQNSDS
jgi:DNA repair exonuclease SbcCD ATPase subunit